MNNTPSWQELLWYTTFFDRNDIYGTQLKLRRNGIPKHRQRQHFSSK